MAARKNKGTKDVPWSDSTRNKIQTSMLVNRLTDHVLGKVDMKPSQVTAALGLIKKTLPDLSAVDMTATLDDKRTRTDYTRDELAEIIGHASDGGGGTSQPNGRGGTPDSVH